MTPITDERAVILRVLQGIESATTVGEHRRDLWERCWGEEKHTIPSYMDSEIVRSKGRCYFASGEESRFLASLRLDLYERYLDGVAALSEFGCGLGQNLIPLRRKLELHGFDWSAAAVERVRHLGISADEFDMFHPRQAEIAGHAVLTVHAMEQLGTRWGEFLKFLLGSGPRIVLHIEPAYELYREDDLLDFLALRYHEKRDYLRGYLPELQQLDSAGKIDLLEVRRSYFGSLFHEAYTVIVWRTK